MRRERASEGGRGKRKENEDRGRERGEAVKMAHTHMCKYNTYHEQ